MTISNSTKDKLPSWSVELLHEDTPSKHIYCHSYAEARPEGILHGGAYIIARLVVEEGYREYVKGEN